MSMVHLLEDQLRRQNEQLSQLNQLYDSLVEERNGLLEMVRSHESCIAQQAECVARANRSAELATLEAAEWRARSKGVVVPEERAVLAMKAIRNAGPAFPAYDIASNYLREVGVLVEWQPKPKGLR